MTISLKPFNRLKYDKNWLYRIEDNTPFEVRETHPDAIKEGDDVVRLSFDLQENQYGIFAYEYRRPGVKKEGSKATDILACLVDEEKKQVTSLIMDLKKNIMNYDDDLLVNDSLNKALNGVSDFVCQLKDEKLHKDSFMLYYKDEGYSETESFGIATRKFEPEKLESVVEFVDEILNDESEEITDIVRCKIRQRLEARSGDVETVRNFAKKKVFIAGNYYDLQVVKLVQNGNDYEADVKLK
ncbi:MAG: hypothetical protein SOZ17_05500 [Agathobacter sp.]|nr:hypothetical protein [Agathobacter sp.]